ncbi:galactosylceramide sulfotransferase-like [Bolinopsis microptera]|uniref:galactosylceramide sulfotransferase-like n=1 Tax=Bolinopsis microptera TaxID=2820187 RepID=UPI003079E120
MSLAKVIQRIKKEWQIIVTILGIYIFYYTLTSINWPKAQRRLKSDIDPEVPIKTDSWIYNPGKVYPPEWYAIPKKPDPQCKPKHNLHFLRTHQTGTSSITNIFYRYGQEHDLKFVMNALKLNLNYPGRINMHYLESVKPPQGYSILCQYSRFHKMDALRIMPDGTIFTTLLRHPVDQFLSVFHNHGIKEEIRNLQPHHNPYEEFFRNPKKISMMASDAVFHLIQNSMSFDLGLNPLQFPNETAVDELIKKVDEDFHLVIIIEMLDECLVLLRRLMCWDLKHMIYVKLSVNNEYSNGIKPEIREKILDWNSVDKKLYDHFYKKLQRIISEQDEDFHKEVAMLKKINAEFWRECYSNVLPVFDGNKIGYTLQDTHSDNKTCKTLATDDVTQTHVIGLKQFKDTLPPSDILMVRNHMQNLGKFNPAMLKWGDVYNALDPDDAYYKSPFDEL